MLLECLRLKLHCPVVQIIVVTRKLTFTTENLCRVAERKHQLLLRMVTSVAMVTQAIAWACLATSVIG